MLHPGGLETDQSTPSTDGKADLRRSALMARIRSRDTGPELAVRRMLHAMGHRFGLHRRDLPGKPDVVLPARRLALFVHGCFWHRHPGCRFATFPKTRADYWGPKLAGNVARDRRASEQLAVAGWRVEVIWECELRDADQLRDRLAQLIVGAPRLSRRNRRNPQPPSTGGEATNGRHSVNAALRAEDDACGICGR